jgi:hypothetical protein
METDVLRHTRIEGVNIIVGDTAQQGHNLMLTGRAAQTRVVKLRQLPIHRHPATRLDLTGCPGHDLRGQERQLAEAFFVTPRLAHPYLSGIGEFVEGNVKWRFGHGE